MNTFRLEHREALAGLFVQVLKLCKRAGLKTVGHVALDGSKVKANASKHKAMSYGRMKDEEKRLAAEIKRSFVARTKSTGRKTRNSAATSAATSCPRSCRSRPSATPLGEQNRDRVPAPRLSARIPRSRQEQAAGRECRGYALHAPSGAPPLASRASP